MTYFLSALALLFIILGFAGFALGVVPTIIAWVIAAFCITGAWKSRSPRQQNREDRMMGRGSR